MREGVVQGVGAVTDSRPWWRRWLPEPFWWTLLALLMLALFPMMPIALLLAWLFWGLDSRTAGSTPFIIAYVLAIPVTWWLFREHPAARNGLLRSRRPDPRTLTDDQVRSLVFAAYLGEYSEGNREAWLRDVYEQGGFPPMDGNHGRAAVVFHLPEKMMPRRVLREFEKQSGGPWLPYRWYALVWCQENIDYALMGDDTAWDVIRPGNSFGDSNAACGEAEEWLRRAGEDVRRVPWEDLPWVAQTFATAALRRGF